MKKLPKEKALLEILEMAKIVEHKMKKIGDMITQKNRSGSVSLPRDLIGSETFVLRTGYANPLPIYN